MKKVFFISGLGADKRAFSFLDLSFCEPVFIDWINPLKKESLPQYAIRLKEKIKDPAPIIVGVSFAGMLATEIAKSDSSAKVISISSNKINKEFPKILLVGKHFPAYKWIPSLLLKKAGILRTMFFGPNGKNQKKIFQEILNDTDFTFNKWAIYSILHWENNIIPDSLIHIHGTSDKLLPYRLVNAHYTVDKGTHLMIMNMHKEISDLLERLI